MLYLSTLYRRLVALVRRRALERDLDDELAFHLAMSEEHQLKAGLSPDEARLTVRRQFGSVTICSRIRELSAELRQDDVFANTTDKMNTSGRSVAL
jgi:hypothetical protein